jgi:hypothetical protein
MAKKKESRHKMLKRLYLLGQGIYGAGVGAAAGTEIAAMQMADIVAPQIAARSPQLVQTATNIIVGSSAAGGAVGTLTTGLIMLKLYESGKIHLPAPVAKKLKSAVAKLEDELKSEGISVKEHLESAEKKLRRVI